MKSLKSQLVADKPLTGECWNALKKKKKHTSVKEKPQQDSWRSTMKFKIKLHIHQRALKGTNKTLCETEPRKKSSDPIRD